MKQSTLNQIQGVLVTAGRSDLAEELIAGKAETYKCPTCGTKVLKTTNYCLKCKKKVSPK